MKNLDMIYRSLPALIISIFILNMSMSCFIFLWILDVSTKYVFYVFLWENRGGEATGTCRTPESSLDCSRRLANIYDLTKRKNVSRLYAIVMKTDSTTTTDPLWVRQPISVNELLVSNSVKNEVVLI